MKEIKATLTLGINKEFSEKARNRIYNILAEEGVNTIDLDYKVVRE